MKTYTMSDIKEAYLTGFYEMNSDQFYKDYDEEGNLIKSSQGDIAVMHYLITVLKEEIK